MTTDKSEKATSFLDMMEGISGTEPAAADPAAEQLSSSPAADPSAVRITALEAELANAKDQMLRALAETENTRKRAMKDREDMAKFAIASFARDLLDFTDNFTRALQAFPADLKSIDDRLAGVVSGIETMEKEMLRTLEKHGIRKIEPMDELFNPNFHEVIFEAPAAGKRPGTVIQVIEPGYILKDRLLRPARVGVAKAGAPDTPPPETPGSRIDQEA